MAQNGGFRGFQRGDGFYSHGLKFGSFFHCCHQKYFYCYLYLRLTVKICHFLRLMAKF